MKSIQPVSASRKFKYIYRDVIGSHRGDGRTGSVSRKKQDKTFTMITNTIRQINNCHMHNPAWSLLLVLMIYTSCSGQVKTQQPKITSGPIIATIGHPKMVKTRVTDKYANVHCGLQDKAGNLWFGTTGEGVYRFDGKSFTNFTEKDGLNSNTVYSVLEDKTGSIWFGTDAGLCRYDGKTFAPVPVTVNNGSNSYPLPGTTSTGSQTEVWTILQDNTGIIWFGTSDGVY
ncbi:MAG: two-component regulator propeller domain-containing protein, partial [Bacteroidota bacterium]